MSHAHEDRALIAAEFDAAFYLGAYPDVAASGGDPADHFLRFGWKEGRDPSSQFSVADYLDAYPDVAAAGLNPLVHYLRSGRSEGRSPRNALGFRYQIIAQMEPVETRLAKARAAAAKVTPSAEADLARALATSRGGGLHLTFSHDDYVSNVGGIQLCLQREAAQIAGLGRDHLNLCPATPWPMLRTEGEATLLGVTWNGVHVGAFETETVRQALAGLAAGPRSLAIHSLLGHEVDEVVAFVHAAGATEGVFWLHDFASICAGYHLLRNDVADCAAPPPDSAACAVCVYGPHRARHLDAHQRLFEALALTVVAPSQAALSTWRKGWRFPARAEVVLPHAVLAPREDAAVAAGPLRVAFAGWAAPLKGWTVFRDLALKYAKDDRYEFLHLGTRTPGGLPIRAEAVSVTDNAPLAMRDAMARLAVDVAVIWPLCQETFSFTAYEAFAAGAAILTHPDSGNVAAFVDEGDRGVVLPDESALDALFASGEILAFARSRRRPKLQDLVFSRMTVDLLDQDKP